VTDLEVTSQPFGVLEDGSEVDLYLLRRLGGIECAILTYGGIIQSLRVPARTGKLDNVVLGFSDLARYVAAPNLYLGAIVGRYANRIARGAFSLDGRSHQLSQNDGRNHLHGGHIGFDKKVWRARTRRTDNDVGLVRWHSSLAGDEGYPGALEAEVVYTLAADDVIRIEYRAVATQPTIVSLTNHSLFNLAGEGNGTILTHQLEINAARYLSVDAELIPTGELSPVEGTPFDFRSPARIGSRIGVRDPQLVFAGGYDHNYVLNDGGDALPVKAARLTDGASGRTLEVRTTEPGLQVYTGNRLDGSALGVSGRRYERFGGIALETQRFPDSPNHPRFPSAVLRPGETLSSITELRFGPARPSST
jgi:aldose 1-epimerase